MQLTNKRGKHSFILPNKPVITGWASVVGKKESEGPLRQYFDICCQDTRFGQKTWEQAENKMQKLAVERLITKCGLEKENIGLVFSGDLLNQCMGSSFSMNNTGIPQVGLYGACSTMAESLMMAAMTVDGGYTDRVIAEPYLENKRELECGYFSAKGKELFTNAGEILSNGSFYDYESKYGGGTRTATVAHISPEINDKIKEYSARLVSALGVRHLSRIDFFLSGEDIYFNEINTMPGFTAESLYPRMLLTSGIDIPEMLDLLIGDAL